MMRSSRPWRRADFSLREVLRGVLSRLKSGKMANAEKELEEALLGVGNRILNRPSALEELLPILHQAATLLPRVEQSPSQSMSAVLSPLMKGMASKELLGHPDADVRVHVAACISEITRITAPETPYDDDLMKEIFKIIVESFGKLGDVDNDSYSKRVSILETAAKVRSCVVMLDLECDDLILEMFNHFMKNISDKHPANILSSMEGIMTVVIEESEDISPHLLSCLLVNTRKDAPPSSRSLAERVIGACVSKLKPCLPGVVRSLGAPLDCYIEIVGSLCPEDSTISGSKCSGSEEGGEKAFGIPPTSCNGDGAEERERNESTIRRRGRPRGSKGIGGMDVKEGEVRYDESLVGAQIRVWWPDDEKFYRGVVGSYDPETMKHKVLYVDGDEEDLLLKDEVFRFLKHGVPKVPSTLGKRRKSVSNGSPASERPRRSRRAFSSI